MSDGDDELGRLSLQFLLPFLILGQDECEETSDIAAWVRSAAAVLSPCNTAHQLAILLQSRHQADTVGITAGPNALTILLWHMYAIHGSTILTARPCSDSCASHCSMADETHGTYC